MMGLCLISGVAAATEPAQPEEAVNGLKATLRVQGSTFREGEYIPLELELHNVSNAPFSIYRDLGPTPTPAGVTFLLRHGEGPVIQEFSGGSKTAFQYIRLEPGDSKQYPLVMTMRHPNEPGPLTSSKNVGAPVLEITRLLEPGNWELWVKVHYQKGAGKVAGINDAWEGAIVSNPVQFRVAEARPSAVRSGTPKAGESVNGLKATLTIPGNTFRLGEQVALSLELHNVSSTPFSVPTHLHTGPIRPGYVRGFVRLADGTLKGVSLETSSHQPALPSFGEDVVELDAGATRTYPMVLHLLFITNRSEEEATFDRAQPILLFFDPGRYELLLEMSCEAEHSQTSGVWEGVVVSNPVSFEVVEPQ